MKPIYAAMCTENNEIWLIGLYEEYQDAFDVIIEDLKETINYHMEDDNYSDKKLTDDMFTPGAEMDMTGNESHGFYTCIRKDGISAELATSSGRFIEWRVKRADKVNTHQDVLDEKKKKEEERK